MKEGEVLKKLRDKLQEENEQLRGDKELNDMMVQEKIVQVKQQKEQIRQVKQGIKSVILNEVFYFCCMNCIRFEC